MPLNFINIIRKIGLNAPPIYLSVFGLLLVFIGAIFDYSELIDFGAILFIIGFFLTIIWLFISRIRTKEKNKRK
jgi:hypothetical protein